MGEKVDKKKKIKKKKKRTWPDTVAGQVQL